MEPDFTPDELAQIEAHLAEFEGRPVEGMLAIAYPYIHEQALSGMLAGGNPKEIVKEWLNEGFFAACTKAGMKLGELGKEVWEALQDPHFAHQTYLVSIVVSFLCHQLHWYEDVPLKDIVATALLLASLSPKRAEQK